MPSGSPWLAPGALAFGATEVAFLALYATTVLFVPSHAALVRLTAVVALFALTYMLQDAFFQWTSNPHWRGFTAASLPVQLMSASDIIFITRLNSTAIRGRTILHQAYRAIVLLLNQRRIGTIWQVKNVPPTTTSSRTTFLRSRLATTLLAYLALDALTSGPTPPAAMIAPQKQTLLPAQLSTLSRADLTFRLSSSLLYWLSGFLLLLLVSNALALPLVATGLSSPHDRPPLFGALADAYSLRRCWGAVWHQCLRRGLTAHADFVADRVLRIPRGCTLLSRYARLFAAFGLSGLVHHVCVRAMGVPPAESGALVFFLLQALGIVVEDAVQAVCGVGRAAGSGAGAGAGRGLFARMNAGLRRGIGYVWVVAFVAWSSPTWFYAQSRVGTDPEILLPVRVARPLVGMLKGFVRA
ncbi:tri7-like toxin biosynthesis protein [Diplodia corticola]|uniref:Tri7-like toxin biosynthesis protein n=1 Tax=Diplodia corticola TaxID=236234 RepID=A0A1J9QQL3_9PEZI|nr:tri7-like toxin biosynthesis protein [Diplodia corticola]OJD31222.1 tri7-like toxin biosynthesis protein [Diplodia corticola]